MTSPDTSKPESEAAASPLEQLIRWRRDVRRFRTDPVPSELLDHVLRLADLSPSVGNSQPWRVLRVTDPEQRQAVRANFEAARAASSARYDGDKADRYASLKLAGFDAAPIHLAVFCDHGSPQGDGLGRQTMPEALEQSCTCMITVLWLAAREAGLGLGWVSILDPLAVGRSLNVPLDWKLVGYLLLGWPEEEHLDPELERHGWQARTPFETRFQEGVGSAPKREAIQPSAGGGSVTLVGAGPGDPDLLTVRAMRALQAADAVLFDDLVAKPILDLVRQGAQLIDVGKRGYRTSCKQPDINAQLIDLARQGLKVVRLKSGDPLIFGRAGEEITACREAGIPISVVPGITSAQGAAANLGVSLTHRDHARRLQFITAHDRHGHLPPDIDWSAVADAAATTIIYMPKRTLPELTAIAMAHGLDPATPALAIANATRPDEWVLRSTVGEIGASLHAEDIEGPVLVMLGEALREALGETGQSAVASYALASALTSSGQT
jgi:uroporphyrin-III C-methyltransferase / precorrin-2 dehydrogenase / sirohydrochlorin ferrochelatase